jgi:hypothetical protein
VEVAAPNGAAPAPFVAAPVAAKKSAATPNAIAMGGHSPEPSVASRFDGSRDGAQPLVAAPASSMHGLGGGPSAGLPQLAGGRAVARPALAGSAPLRDSAAASSVLPREAPITASAALPAAPEEDFSYTYLSPARHRYDMSSDPPKPQSDWRYYAALAARIAAVLAAAYLAMHSDFGFLAGIVRRRRDQ